MAPLPDIKPHTALAMDAATIAKANSGDSAGIPMSAVGNPCDRSIWYGFRWVAEPEAPTGQRERRFRTGIAYERWLLDDLRSTGADVREIDEATGKQFAVNLGDGHIRGKLDGLATGVIEAPKTEHVVECKSHNEKSFKALLKDGLEKSKPDHYAQCQLYMHATGATRCLYLAANKNTDEIHTERLDYDPAFCIALVAKLERIIASTGPLAANEYFGCSWCRAKGQCQEGQFARVNCRTCLHSEPRGAASWHCVRWDKPLSYADQKAGCPAHRFIPALVPGEQVDVLDGDVITYRLADGSEYRDGEGR